MGKLPPINLTMRNTEALIPGSSKLAELRDMAANTPSDRVDPRLLVPSPYQPRTSYPEIEMQELEESVEAAGGIKIPLIVRPDINQIICGGRRHIIALKRGDTSVPVYWYVCSDRDAEELAAFENVKRADLNPIDETKMVLGMVKLRLDLVDRQAAIDLIQSIYARMRTKSGSDLCDNVVTEQIISTTKETIQQFTKGRLQLGTFATQKLKLLNLPADVIDAMTSKGIEYTKAVAISKLEDLDCRADLLRSAISEGMSLSEIKKQVKDLKPATKQQNPTPKDRVRLTMKKVVSSKVWEDVKKWEEIDLLLNQIDVLLAIDIEITEV